MHIRTLLKKSTEPPTHATVDSLMHTLSLVAAADAAAAAAVQYAIAAAIELNSWNRRR